ncbi:ATP F0F1 synthase subunit B [Pseudorhodoplanes sp.]|jgi:F-type H+-transporting ATPase subunit b|uniref:F0F1 ATP synthase subunit B family protein n=1 Tax=Pseudorhodoplanes sp. TaxID=1934341 RepID=UPI002B5AAAD3|nr:ATP F0F1 synthase subunit B [Pseudorhodoplanes sp.]HWV42227.1 ATP F0F1 synthase subunit B [Pseudorhodoplanes sp.]
MHLIWEAEFWVAVAFLIFLGGLLYVGVHKTISNTLDKRSSRIQAELEEAAKLKSEALALLAEYKQKTANAEQEAAAIIESAKADAERLAAEAHAKLEDFVSRRTKMAETKIAQAEAQALAEVRSIAADVAASAAEKVLALTAKGHVAEQLIARGIDDVKKKLN